MRLYDTMSGQVRDLEPLQPGRLGLYVCGLTTYDHCHIGHARTFLVFDTLVRYLRSGGMQVRYVRNITDVDDRIIEHAARQGVSATELTSTMIGSMHRDFAALGMLEPDVEPCATGSVPRMIEIIEKLIAAGLAYSTGVGNVWYRVSAFAPYGRLSSRQADEGAISRQQEQTADEKEDIRDFALWKAADQNDRTVGAVWDSPWGPGRPGWHIECSAMSTEHLGEEFDLHGGGLDLVFPHHENEIAQSAGVGHPFARHWMHVAPLRMGEAKMSKSLGNVLGIGQALQRWPAEALRYALLTAHYRHPLQFRSERVDQACSVLDKWYGALEAAGPELPASAQGGEQEGFGQQLQEALENDWNLPEAFKILSDLARQINKSGGQPATAAALVGELIRLGKRLGFLGQLPADWFRRQAGVPEEEIRELIAARQRARDEQDYAEADRIRQHLADRGVELLDSSDGTSWRRAHPS